MFAPSTTAAQQTQPGSVQRAQTRNRPSRPDLAGATRYALQRLAFMARNQALRAELAAYGVHSTDVHWFGGQVEFFETHHYFTAAARTLWAAGKQHHLRQLGRRLALALAEDGQHPSPAPTSGIFTT